MEEFVFIAPNWQQIVRMSGADRADACDRFLEQYPDRKNWLVFGEWDATETPIPFALQYQGRVTEKGH